MPFTKKQLLSCHSTIIGQIDGLLQTLLSSWKVLLSPQRNYGVLIEWPRCSDHLLDWSPFFSSFALDSHWALEESWWFLPSSTYIGWRSLSSFEPSKQQNIFSTRPTFVPQENHATGSLFDFRLVYCDLVQVGDLYKPVCLFKLCSIRYIYHKWTPIRIQKNLKIEHQLNFELNGKCCEYLCECNFLLYYK